MYSKKSQFIVFCSAVLMLASGSSVADDETEKIRAGLESMTNGGIGEIVESPMEGVYEVLINNRLYYVYAKGEHVLIGSVFNVENGTELKQEKAKRLIYETVEGTPVEQMVVMKPAESKRYLTVFTDVDCFYCRRFHSEVPELLEAGLEVRYLAFPRAGIGSESYNVMVSVWCAEDTPQAMTDAKNGLKIDEITCPNPVADQYEVGVRAGIQGTPTLITDDGEVIFGYVPFQELLAMLGLAS